MSMEEVDEERERRSCFIGVFAMNEAAKQ